MGLSVSNNVKENSIIFEKNNLINTKSWVVSDGEASIGDNITLKSKSEIRQDLVYSEGSYLKGQYLKLCCKVDCDDKGLSTLTNHNVCISYIINYLDAENNEKTLIDCYYPIFVFEPHFDNGYTIVDIPNCEIKDIEIIINNEEDIDILLYDLGLYVSSTIDEKSLETKVNDYLKETIESDNFTLVIPLVEQLPDINSVPDGYCCRVVGVSL